MKKRMFGASTRMWGCGRIVVGEIRYVVPDEQVRGNAAPGADVVAKRLVLLPFQRLDERALDRAEPHDDILPRPGDLRRLAGVLVGQRLDEHVGELGLDGVGHGVHHAEERAGGAALFRLDRLAPRALATARTIVLADGNQPHSRVLAEPHQCIAGQFLEHFLVGQAELGVLGGPLAADFAIPLGVRSEILHAARSSALAGVFPRPFRSAILSLPSPAIVFLKARR